MLIFGQSYASPKPMSADSVIFKRISEHFMDKVELVSHYASKTRNLNKKEEVLLGLKCYKLAKKSDIVFGWGGDLCLFAFVWSLLGTKRNYYISQNLIISPEFSHEKFHKRIRLWLYKIALKSKYFFVTVNAPGLVDLYSNMFHCSKEKFHVVYDSMSLSKEEQKMMVEQKKSSECPYVFFGGKAFRDIPTFLQIVKLLPDIKFKAVVLKEMLVPEMYELKNLEVFHDLEKDKFYEILNSASVCCIPLKSIAPCGLYVMQHAILMNVPVVSTETPSMRTIIPNDDCGYLLPKGDSQGMAKRVYELLTNKEKAERIVERAKINMEKFTPEAVAKQLCNVLDRMAKKNRLSK